MKKLNYKHMVDLCASDGMDLICVIEGIEIRAKRVCTPVNDKKSWNEVPELKE